MRLGGILLALLIALFALPEPAAAAKLEGVDVRVKPGTHTIARLSGNNVVETRTINRNTRIDWRANPNTRTIGSYEYIELLSGARAGWWLRVRENGPRANGFTYRVYREVGIEPRANPYPAKRFFNSDRIVLRQFFSVTTREQHPMDMRGDFNPSLSRHFRISSGELAGYWVPRNARIRAVPKGSEWHTTTTSSGTTTWTMAMLIYRNLDANCDGKRVRNSLTNGEVQDAVDRTEWFARRVNNWSDGMGRVSVTYIYPGTVTRATKLNSSSGCWVSHQNVRDMGHWPSGFDSVYVQEPRGLHPHGGLAWDGFLPWGSTYGTSPAWARDIWWGNTTEGVNIILHEWLHGAGGFYRNHFGESQVPDLHGEKAYGYSKDSAWYRDFLSGKIAGNKGLTQRVWDYGTPRRN